jgi:hypothetical protein
VGRSRTSSFGRWAAQILGLAVIAATCVVGPRLMEGYGALEWTRFHARQAGAPHGADHARRAAHAAARAVDLTAPLPWAPEAARLALEAGQVLGPKNAPSASAVYGEVRGALDRASASPIRRFGLEGVSAEARLLDDAARQPAEKAP